MIAAAAPIAAAEPSVVAELRNVSKSFGPTRALRSVSLAIRSGEVHCILGENGAGKSTIAKILGGIYLPDDGEILIGGRSVRVATVADARRLGIAMVFQELSLVPDLTVWENIRLGMEGTGNPFTLTRRRTEEAVGRRLLERFDVALDLRARVGSLAVADQQLLEVTKALARQPRLLLLDEPTAMLGVVEKEKLIRVIRDLKADGTTVIFVTHHVEEVVEVADRVTLMKDGRRVESFDVTPRTSVEEIVGKLAGDSAARATERRRSSPGDVVLRFGGLQGRKPGLDVIEMRSGEVVGLYGVAGCGRERMARAAVGLDKLKGTLDFRGRPHRPRSPAAAARAGIAYLPAGRAANCILPSRNIRENIMLSQLRRHQRAGMLRMRAERAETEQQLARFRTRYASAEDSITSLSGGNQQKVVLGRVLGRDSVLAVLEDPTVGVDIAAMQDIHDLIRERVAAGLGIILISSDLPEAIGLCDVIYTLIDDEIVDEYRNPTMADEPSIVADVLGSRSPGATPP